MSKAQIKNVSPVAAAVVASASPAPVASGTPAASKKAPAPKQDRKVIGGDAFNRLVAAGAVLIVLASKGKLFSTVLTQLGGNVIQLDGLSARIAGLTKEWSQFDRGYLVGPSASYSACAVTSSSKKAKKDPAFIYAVPGANGAAPTLMTADGQTWIRPAKGEREQGVYDAALAAATQALTA